MQPTSGLEDASSPREDDNRNSHRRNSAAREGKRRTRKAPQEQAPQAQTGGNAAPPATCAVVCAMDHLSTKLRIPIVSILKTNATASLFGAREVAGTPLGSTSRMETSTVSSSPTHNLASNPNMCGALENSTSVNAMPQASTSADDSMRMGISALHFNEMSIQMNSSWSRNPMQHEDDDMIASPQPPPVVPWVHSAISMMREALAMTTPPATCRLFQDNRCRQGTKCHQVHVVRSVLEDMRREVKRYGGCCWDHGYQYQTPTFLRELEDPTWGWKSALIKHILVPNFTMQCVMSAEKRKGEGEEISTPPPALSLPSLGPSTEHEEDSSRHPTSTDTTPPDLDQSLSSYANTGPHLTSPSGSSGAAKSPKAQPQADTRSEGPLEVVMSLRAEQLSPTLGLCNFILVYLERIAEKPVDTRRPITIDVPFTLLCKGHQRGPVCKFDDQCRYIHACREFTTYMTQLRIGPSQGETGSIEPDGADGFSSRAATAGTSSASRGISSQEGSSGSHGSHSSPNDNARRREEDDEDDEHKEQLSHILLPLPTPPPANVQVKRWQNMPYLLRRRPKRPTTEGGRR